MNILFVCTANITRSAMSEAILKKLVSDEPWGSSVTVASAGTEGLVDIAPDKTTVKICKEHGIDVASHLARQLSPEMVAGSSLILCLSESHKKMIVEAMTDAEEKVYLLKEFGQSILPADLSVQDPTGKSKKNYQECFDEIYAELIRILPLIKSRVEQESVLPSLPPLSLNT